MSWLEMLATVGIPTAGVACTVSAVLHYKEARRHLKARLELEGLTATMKAALAGAPVECPCERCEDRREREATQRSAN